MTNYKTLLLKRLVCGLSFIAFGLAGSVAFGQGDLDLNTWSQEGPPGAGNWTVSADGSNVLQTTNGAPTYFVSSGGFLGSTFNGKFGVETTSDDDFIGFVFGYNAPLGSNGDPDLLADYILFDWKQNAQGSAAEGFWLGKVSGTQNGIAGIGNQLWDHGGDAGLTLTQLGLPLVNEGWQDNVEYDLELAYFADRIQISIQGGTGAFTNLTEIYNVNISDLPGGTFAGDMFPNGRFGFYNHSQGSVRYSSFTAVIPEPAAVLPLTAVVLGCLGRRSRHRRIR